MADLKYLEKESIEKLFNMKTGYVLDFSDRTFQEYVRETVGIDIYDKSYNYASGSKANRLRGFFKVATNPLAGQLLHSLLDYWMAKARMGEYDYYAEEDLYKECTMISERLVKDTGIENTDAFKATSNEKDFKLLAKSIQESISKNEPEAALDRLHTFVIKYVRQLCDEHQISYVKEDSLNSIFGKYVKHLTENSLIESLMSERILKYSIHVLEAFNDIRNNKSFAHDNPILNYNESILIFNNISNSIKFIEALEEKKKLGTKDTAEPTIDDLPF